MPFNTILVEGIMRSYLEYGSVIQEEILFKDISYLELWQPYCSTECNHLCNFGRGYHEEQFCEIILNLDKSFRRRCFKDLLSRALAVLVFSGAEPFMQFCIGHYWSHSCEIILNLDQWFRGRCL